MNNLLQNKLSRFEASPPHGVWDKIEEALDAQTDFSKRLHQYEEQPRTDIWKNIEAALDEPGAKVVPFYTRFRKPMRYTAAASIIAVILVTTTLLRKRVTADTLPVQSAVILPIAKKTNAADSTTQVPLPSKQKSVPTSVNQVHKTTVTTTQQNTQVSQQEISPNKKGLAKYAQTGDNSIYSYSNGNEMTVSRNALSLLDCAKRDKECKERIRQLRQKLSATNMTSDFAGLLDVIRQLQ